MTSIEPFRRLMGVAGCRTQSELAAFLGVSQSAVAAALKKSTIPANWLLAAMRRSRVNPDWVLYGGGHARYLEERR